MAESVNKPKQMAAYDQLAITSEGYIPYDDNSGFDEENEIIGEIPLQNLSYCDYCSTKLLRIEEESAQKGAAVTIAFGIVKNVDSGRHAFIQIRSFLACRHQRIGRMSQNYVSLRGTCLSAVMRSWPRISGGILMSCTDTRPPVLRNSSRTFSEPIT